MEGKIIEILQWLTENIPSMACQGLATVRIPVGDSDIWTDIKYNKYGDKECSYLKSYRSKVLSVGLDHFSGDRYELSITINPPNDFPTALRTFRFSDQPEGDKEKIMNACIKYKNMQKHIFDRKIEFEDYFIDNEGSGKEKITAYFRRNGKLYSAKLSNIKEMGI